MERPYLSLSALDGPEDVRSLQKALATDSALQVPDSHDLFMGISVDRGTAAGTVPPAPRKLATIDKARELSDALGLPMQLAVHFECYYRDQNLEIPGNVFEYARTRTAPFADDVLRVTDGVNQGALRAVQLNGVIDPDELEKIHAARPDLKVIYQLRRELADRSSEDVVTHLIACRFGIHHVLLDLSAGQGTPMDPAERSRLVGLVQRAAPDARIGIAGGLSTDNIARAYRGAKKETGGHVSVDTETAVRIPEGDRFSPDKGADFLRASFDTVRCFGA